MLTDQDVHAQSNTSLFTLSAERLSFQMAQLCCTCCFLCYLFNFTKLLKSLVKPAAIIIRPETACLYLCTRNISGELILQILLVHKACTHMRWVFVLLALACPKYSAAFETEIYSLFVFLLSYCVANILSRIHAAHVPARMGEEEREGVLVADFNDANNFLTQRNCNSDAETERSPFHPMNQHDPISAYKPPQPPSLTPSFPLLPRWLQEQRRAR